MSNTAPIWVALGAMIFFRERLGRRFWLGLFVAMTGVAILMGVDTFNQVGLGAFLGLLAGIFYGAYFLVMQRSRQEIDAISSFWLAAATSTLFLLLGQPLTGYSAFTYLNFAALGLLVQVVGQPAINFALGYLPASLVAPTLLAQPLLTALLSALLLGESFTWLQVVGGAAALVGVYMVHRSRW